MKRLQIFILLLSFSFLHSQEDKESFPFFSGLFHTTFAINQDYTLDANDDQPFLIPNAALFRFEVGYYFNRRWAASFNFGYDYHFQYFINAIPTFGSIRYNITEEDRNTFFIEYSRGKMFRPSFRFEDGAYNALGLGWTITGKRNSHTVLKVIYHKKQIQNFKNGRLESLSFGVGFAFFKKTIL